jgi:hypothetical protein
MGFSLYMTPGNQALQTGYASLQCSSNVDAQLLYTSYAPDGTKISEATVFSSPSGNWLRIIGDERGGAQLALAIANDSNQSNSYTINAYSAGGTLLGSYTLSLPGTSSRAFFVDDVISVPSQNWGVVDILANNGTGSAIGLRFTGGLFTTVPATILR